MHVIFFFFLSIQRWSVWQIASWSFAVLVYGAVTQEACCKLREPWTLHLLCWHLPLLFSKVPKWRHTVIDMLRLRRTPADRILTFFLYFCPVLNKVLWYKSILMYLGCLWMFDSRICVWSMNDSSGCLTGVDRHEQRAPCSCLRVRRSRSLRQQFQHSSVYYARPLAVLSVCTLLSWRGHRGFQEAVQTSIHRYSMSKVCAGFPRQPGVVN